MKKLIIGFIIFSTLSCFCQGYNSKESSHRGYQNPYERKGAVWSGSGIALNSKMLATNFHVVDGATNIFLYFPETKEKYKAEVVVTDATNDLAIIKIIDSTFNGFPPIKYGFKEEIEDIGVDVFVLGYPLIQTMGEEIKLTTGVVSSKSGFQGNLSQYQVSAPIQPGNSGGPLFNDKGELIGIISAKHSGADNVSYGVKLNYLIDLAKRSEVSIDFALSTQISSLPLSEQCKAVIPHIVMILANNEIPSSSFSQTSIQVSTNHVEYPIRVNSPQITKKNTTVNIDGIEITSNNTAIHLSYCNTEYVSGGWYNVDKNTYIEDKSTGKIYKLIKTENCAIKPQKTSINFNQTKEFILYFEALPESITRFNLYEPDGWKFYDIKIR